MSESMMRACQHKALVRFIAQHGADWKGLLLGLWKTGGGVDYLPIQEILGDEKLTDDYFLVSLRRTHGARWLRRANDEDPIGHMAWLREELKKDREARKRRQERRLRVWQKARARWKGED